MDNEEKSEQYLDVVEEVVPALFTAEEVVKRENIRVKRLHRRNSSMSSMTCNRRQWLNSAYKRFQEFIDEVAKKTYYRQEFSQWFGKISNIQMMWLSIDATEDFEPVLSIIKRGGTKVERDEALDIALRRLALYNDLDLDTIQLEDYDKIMRYMALFCVSSIEDNL
jgi:hypothetical protein